MHRVLLVQGANLSYLGKREPEIYGVTSAEELNKMLLQHADIIGIQLEIFYTNLEGEAIERIYKAKEEGVNGLVMNPSGFTYAGYALRDCILAVSLPYVEIHISNIHKRKITSVLADIAVGVITGFGIDGYFLALDGMELILSKKEQYANLF